MKELHFKRLENVVRALEESREPKAFDMNKFVHDEADAEYREGEGLKPFACGTPACALGHYGDRRDLQRVFWIGVDKYGETNLLTARTDATRLEVAADHFGITYDESRQLFEADGCGGAKTVRGAAGFIRRFIARKRREQKAARR